MTEFMIKIHFSEESANQLREIAMFYAHPSIRLKALALLLKSQKTPHHIIESTLNICGNTLRSYLRAYQDGGLDELTKIRAKGSTSRLAQFDEQIRDYITKKPPCSIKQAQQEIKQLTGVDLSMEQIRRHLSKLNVKYRKVGTIPAKADIAAQEEFKTTKLEPRLTEAKDGLRDVYFVDAAHFVLGAFLGFLWSFTRVFVRTPSGRQRFNVLGALNAITKELSVVTNDTYITSIEVCELLRNISATALKPVTIVLDNARYQRCKLVTDLADKLEIELLFLPPYSPNLNLIERLWKFTKKECLNSKYYADFKSFSGAIIGFLSNMHTTKKEELASLLTLNFQTFTEEQIRTAA